MLLPRESEIVRNAHCEASSGSRPGEDASLWGARKAEVRPSRTPT